MAANDTRTTGKVVDADELFMRLSVPELNVYERRTRTDIENKKQELRMMVGERYRDLIGAADCIVRMKETALSVQGNISKMRNSCDIHALKRSVATKTMKEQTGAVDDMKKSLYTSAAQIKLLADAPEQIWRNMESNHFLTAGRVYLLSKAIYKNLDADVNEEAKRSVKVMETFPVVARQWDAVSHFKAQILQKSTRHLKLTKGSNLDVVETMCAIMLLDDVTIKDMFRLLLTQRQSAIKEALESKDGNVGDHILHALEVLQSTLHHVAGVFLEPERDQVSPFERHLKSLKNTFTSPSPVRTSSPSASSSKDEFSSTILLPSAPVGLSASVIPKLYPTTPNVHLLVRYLPESIQNFTPTIQLEGSRAKFAQKEVLDGVRLWMEDVRLMFGGALEVLLQRVQTSAEMVQIRARVWAVLQQDEYALTSKSAKSPWNDVCRLLLGKTASLWNDVLRAGFSRAIQDIIVYSLEELSHQPEKVLRQRLGELDDEDDPNHDLGRFVWHDSAVTKGASLPSATEPLIQRIREYVGGKTDLVAQTTKVFEDKLAAIRSDAEQALVYNKEAVFGKLQELDEDDHDRQESLDLFEARTDISEITEFYQGQFVECIKAYTFGLERLVQDAVRKPEKARLTLSAMDRAMTIGRIASSVGSMGDALQRAMVPPRDRSSAATFAQARAQKANVETQVQGLVQGLQKVYLLSHEAWISSIEWTFTRGMRHYLQYSSWTDLSTLSWEPIPSANPVPSPKSSGLSKESSKPSPTLSSPAGEESKTLLPFHGSTLLLTALHQVVQEMHRVGTGFMRPELVQVLSAKLARVAFTTTEQFLKDVVVISEEVQELPSVSDPAKNPTLLSERGAMQLLFDVKFLNIVFQPSQEKERDADQRLRRLVQSVTSTIKGYIDPINVAVFDKPLDINADRQYSRVAVLLGLLVQLNPMESKRKVNVVEKSPHVFAMAPLTARFTLLPIGQKMTGRVL